MRTIFLNSQIYFSSLALKENRAYRFIHISGSFGVINLDERYFKTNLLGSGSFANVYKAVSYVTQIRRAIKIINKDQCERQIGPGFSKYLYREV
jgi:hypothetical protein